MPRSIWNGVISFGMVSIPVKLYTATDDKDISFHLLHKECGSRLKQLRWCPVCEREVSWDEAGRGYEYARDQHVLLEEEDFARLPLASKHTIQLSAFVDASEIDPIYYERSYYLEPEETGVKPYALLMRALKEKGLTALAKVAVRNKERLCSLRPYNGTLILETMLHPDEIRVEKGEDSDIEVSERELGMAFTLIDLLSEPFDPSKYHDDYREALMEIIQAKLEGQEIVEAPAAPARVTDLMAALKASVEAAQKGRQEAEATGGGGRRRKAAAG
ncbi:MAG: Ku protein [Chloroflexi bacterium]|nr:Ku protein [Chloroflexota bacterium]